MKADSRAEGVDKALGHDDWSWDDASKRTITVPGKPGHVGKYCVEMVTKSEYDYVRRQEGTPNASNV